jgi:hypothetical protein
MRISFFLIIIIFFCNAITAQHGNWLKGYTEDLTGEVLTYHSPHPEVTTSLLIRNQDSTKYIEWLMDEIPANTDTREFTFVWIFGIDVNVNTYSYRLYLDGEYLLSFNNPQNTLTKTWTIEGLYGTSLAFNATLVDKYGDLMGYAFLTIPSKLLKERERPEVRITATSSDDPCWYMTHRYPMDSRLMAKQMPAVINSPEGEHFLIRLDIHHFGEKTNAEITARGKLIKIPIDLGVNYTYIPIEGKAGDEVDDLSVSIDGNVIYLDKIILEEVRPMTLYLLHHSHVDIGYTHHQSVVERMHHGFFRNVARLSEDTKGYPEGSRFKWNTEVCWAVESYLEQCTPKEKQKFIRAVQDGGIGLDGLWANELTGLCRPEELIQLIQRSAQVANKCGVELKSAMITDIPGYTWGLVPVMAKSGIRYFSPGTNVGHRIGDIKDTWGDKPFYWVSQSGQDSVLTWFPSKGYSWFHTGLGTDKPRTLLTEEPIFEYVNQLNKSSFPYDISVFRYNIGSDNGPPHPILPGIIKRWNAKYSTPQIAIATTAEAFSAFEDKYGQSLPAYQGDLTPYWEDGAASSAQETAIVREAAERLVQAQTLWVVSGNKHYPLKQVNEAWKNILLYDEHTWGSWNSISAPHDEFTIRQWETKKSFALKADSITAVIMKKAIATAGMPEQEDPLSFDIWNTHSWSVSDVIILPVPEHIANAYATDENNNRLNSQGLSDGNLAVLVNDIPPFAAVRIKLKSDDHTLIDPEPWRNQPDVEISIDPETGDIISLRHPKLNNDLADTAGGFGLNSYFYVEGRNPQHNFTTKNAKISYPEKGKLVNTIHIESEAPGADKLIREITMYSGLDRVDITNTIYKTAVYEPEGVHFGFPFHIPQGKIRVGIAWGYFQPERDQLPGSNKNYYTLNRWVDVSSDEHGLCMISLDAPMLELGEISTDATSYGWKDVQEPTQTIFSYVMNNYWETNYLAAQSGKVDFRYSLCVHEGFDPVFNEKRSLERSQPLLVIPSSGRKKLPWSLFTIDNQNVIITALIPGDDRQHFLIRIYNPSKHEETVNFNWKLFKPKQVSVAGLSGENPRPLTGALIIGVHSFETIRIDFF